MEQENYIPFELRSKYYCEGIITYFQMHNENLKWEDLDIEPIRCEE